jgi:hypothetical protein
MAIGRDAADRQRLATVLGGGLKDAHGRRVGLMWATGSRGDGRDSPAGATSRSLVSWRGAGCAMAAEELPGGQAVRPEIDLKKVPQIAEKVLRPLSKDSKSARKQRTLRIRNDKGAATERLRSKRPLISHDKIPLSGSLLRASVPVNHIDARLSPFRRVAGVFALALAHRLRLDAIGPGE